MVNFAAGIAIFCCELPKDFTGDYYGNQLLRSGGSSVLNFGEAQGTNAVRDDIFKASISLKELEESSVNLKILNKIGYGNTSKRE